jgi:dTMP kinase
MTGCFITFEGTEGSGKSTQLQLLADWLFSMLLPVVTTREPGGAGDLGAKVREILLSGIDVVPKAELFLFLADRAQHVATIVRPSLAAGSIVLCDRYVDSTTVYQGIARGMGLERAMELNRFATDDLLPDLTLLLDLPAEAGLARLDAKDRLDGEDIEFHRAVRDGFLQLAKREKRIQVIPADGDSGPIQDRIRGIVSELLTAKGYNMVAEADG